MQFISESPDQTIEFGTKLAQKLYPGICIALIGELGAGKTTLVKGLAKGLGITQRIVSPTFLLIKEYKNSKIPFYHIDCYRISDPKELLEVGADDYLLTEDGVTAVEWAEKVMEILPPGHIEIKIKIEGIKKRRFMVKQDKLR